ncbi:hypothetical protein BZL30_2160 [Mycobacterium kansasii]|uniref:Uncharacterized protein n=1 Tax=Mycobacterium kansasii TaxID=1768 RepID=A0A1V3XJ77_MYCKA|nr:hypothetical protein BZL30_2160 [Mycobacterium kansasii]
MPMNPASPPRPPAWPAPPDPPAPPSPNPQALPPSRRPRQARALTSA